MRCTRRWVGQARDSFIARPCTHAALDADAEPLEPQMVRKSSEFRPISHSDWFPALSSERLPHKTCTIDHITLELGRF